MVSVASAASGDAAAGPARSVAGTHISGSQASSTNTAERRERAIWNKPTYRFQSADPAQPFFVDPRILQVVAKNDPKVLENITIPDGMNVLGKVHMKEKPKAVAFLKQQREEVSERRRRLHARGPVRQPP